MERNENYCLRAADLCQLLLMTNPEHPLAGSDFKLRILEDKENRDVHVD
jgi:hypothetical protein